MTDLQRIRNRLVDIQFVAEHMEPVPGKDPKAVVKWIAKYAAETIAMLPDPKNTADLAR